MLVFPRGGSIRTTIEVSHWKDHEAYRIWYHTPFYVLVCNSWSFTFTMNSKCHVWVIIYPNHTIPWQPIFFSTNNCQMIFFSCHRTTSRIMRKPTFSICENKGADSLAVTVKLINAFVFPTQIVQFVYFLNPKFPVSSHLLCLYS